MLNFSFEDCFSDRIGLCIKDNEKNVIFQNQVCKSVCGVRGVHSCEVGCIKSYVATTALPFSAEGAKIVRVEKKEKIFDAVIINDGNRIITLLYSLSEKIERELEFLKSFQLSPREIEVVSKVLRGQSNAEISFSLFISLKTLKTHINNIYKKLPAEVVKELKARETTGINTTKARL